MSYRYLSNSLIDATLRYLGCPMKSPSLPYLNQLIAAYIRRVPWESVSRIMKRSATRRTEDCPRYPEEFWLSSIQQGFGGTCFESSLAFYSLLTELGFEGYLTVNDMGTSQACHAAIVVLLEKQKHLVDITIPLFCALRFTPQHSTRRRTWSQNYVIRPASEDHYDVMRSHRSSRYIFTLVDRPVDLPDYRLVLENDYAVHGLFLNRVVMVKVISNRVHRFFSDNKPYKIERFSRAGRSEMFLKPELLSYCLATLFQMSEAQISAALTYVGEPMLEPAGSYCRISPVLEGSLR